MKAITGGLLLPRVFTSDRQIHLNFINDVLMTMVSGGDDGNDFITEIVVHHFTITLWSQHE